MLIGKNLRDCEKVTPLILILVHQATMPSHTSDHPIYVYLQLIAVTGLVPPISPCSLTSFSDRFLATNLLATTTAISAMSNSVTPYHAITV